MLQYLGVIEGRTNEILLLHSALQEGEDDEPDVVAQREPMSQLQVGRGRRSCAHVAAAGRRATM